MHVPCSTRRRAFTLIELLVVVSIIVLLVSVLLPSLAKSREQAKRVKCLANLKALGVAATMYLADFKDRFCWGPVYPLQSDGSFRFRTWYYGGMQGIGTAHIPLPPATLNNWPAEQRPLNRYVYAASKLGKGRGLEVYLCPADQGVRWDDDPASNPSVYVTAYQEMGTSYDANLNWLYYTAAYEGNSNARKLELANGIVRMMKGRNARRYILLDEDPLDWILANSLGNVVLPGGYKVMGWHGKVNVHNVLFLDGRADSVYVNPTLNKHVTGGRTAPPPSGNSVWCARQEYNQKTGL